MTPTCERCGNYTNTIGTDQPDIIQWCPICGAIKINEEPAKICYHSKKYWEILKICKNG